MAKTLAHQLNGNKSVHVDFTNRRTEQIRIVLNNHTIPYANATKYSGMNLDINLRWKSILEKYVRTKSQIKINELPPWCKGANSEPSKRNIFKLYRQVLKPGVQGLDFQVIVLGAQCGCASAINFEIIRRFQNKVLKYIVKTPSCIRNRDLHRNLCVKIIADEINKFAQNLRLAS